MTFRDKLLELKDKKGWSEKELAKRAGVSWGAVHSYLQQGKSRRLPSVAVFVALARALGVKLEVLADCEEFQIKPEKPD
jgi:transcriptional regulator with XRE-family HTH domain